MRVYINVDDILKMKTNRRRSSTMNMDDDIYRKYILLEDAIRQLIQLISQQRRVNEQNMNSIDLPCLYHDLYRTIRELEHLSKIEEYSFCDFR
jgi:hypothetical protein